jgi:hypothetical protein
MLDVLTAISLILLLIGHTFLIRGCFSIKDQLPVTGGVIAERIDKTSELLDEVAQLIADLSEGMTGGNTNSPQTITGIPDLLSAFLNSRMNMANADGAKTQGEWEILPPNENSQEETSN